MPTPSYRLLFLESGNGYGGSSTFLYSFLKHLDRAAFEPIVVFYPWTNAPVRTRIHALGIQTFCVDYRRPFTRSDSKNSVKNVGDDREQTHLQRARPPQAVIGSMIGGVKTIARKTINPDVYEDLWTLAHNTPRGMRRLLRLTKLLRTLRADAVILNNDVQYHAAGIIAARLTRTHCICRKAGIGGYGVFKRALAHGVTAYLASSTAAAKNHLNAGLFARKMATIHEGVDVERFDRRHADSPVRREFGIEAGAVVVGSVSRIMDGKGQGDLITAAKIVLERFPQTRFIIAGSDTLPGQPLLRKLKRQAQTLGVSRQIIFAGWREDVGDILPALDIFVQPNSTLPEGLCIAVLEAMAAGRPTVVTASGGLPETTVDGATGLVVPPAQPRLLAEALLKLIENPKLRQTLGRSARKRACDLFDIRETVRKSQRVFLEVLAQRSRR